MVGLGSHGKPISAAELDFSHWDKVVEQARSQEVYFNAWGGDKSMNEFIAWAGDEIRQNFGIELKHVRVADTASVVARVLAEKQAGNINRGAVDLLWLNGENFAGMKSAGLLFGPWAENIPNFALTAANENPDVREDFTVAVEGFEAPWTRSQLVFYYDSRWLKNPPRNMAALLQWAKHNPSEFSYPRPPDFLGTTFLKQALLELVSPSNRSALFKPVCADTFEKVTAELWQFLDSLHPNLLRSGLSFPTNGAAMRRLLADGEVSLAYSFSPGEAASAIAENELPNTVRSYVFDSGSIANVSFLGIPFNAKSKAGAAVVANFLLSPEAQLRAQDPAVLGSSSVLALAALSSDQQKAFDDIERGPAFPSQQDLSRHLPEPHPSWVAALERAWLQRYLSR